MHRFEPPIDVPFEHHFAEDPDLGGFVVLLQGEVGLLPVGPDPPALKPFHLAVHLLAGVGGGLFAQFDRCQRLALILIHRLQHLQFDRQAMAVPTRDVANLASSQDLIFVDHILENLVQGMAHMQGAIGVRRSVVQGEDRP